MSEPWATEPQSSIEHPNWTRGLRYQVTSAAPDKEDFESSFYQILSARHSERGSHGKQASGYRVLMQVLAVLASSTGAGVYSVDLTSYSNPGRRLLARAATLPRATCSCQTWSLPLIWSQV